MHKHTFLSIVFLIALLVLTACGGDKSTPESAAAADSPPAQVALAGDATSGGRIYATACVACHGADAKGVTGLGKDLTTSQFITDNSDGQLAEFIKKGRDMGDPLNTTGVAMPPKGGNPAMSDQEIADIVAYLRSIHQQ